MLSMPYITRTLVVSMALVMCGLTTSVQAAKGNPGAGEGKSGLCGGCHGMDGNSQDTMIPRLAGQYAAYIAKQVQDFKKGHRTNNDTMSGMAAMVASSQDAWDIGAYFQTKEMKGLLSKPNKQLEAKGEEFFRNGNPDKGIYACINCHGESGKGKSKKISSFPVIGGQHRDYIVKQLQDFRSGARTNDPAGMMNMIAKKLTDKDIEALAEYLSTQL